VNPIYKHTRSMGQRSRSQCNITYQQLKRYTTGTDRLTNFKLDGNYPDPSGERTRGIRLRSLGQFK